MSTVAEVQQRSPALRGQSELYPASWHGKVPKRVGMAKTVASDFPCDASRIRVENRNEYEVWVNSHGAIAAIFNDGEKMGLKAYEFEVIEWHESKSGPVTSDF